MEGISDRLIDSSGVQTLLVTARTAGTAAQLRAQGGVQYDASRLRFGAAMRTPGLTLFREGTITLDGVVDRGATSLGASLFDANARFDYRLPWELQAGVGVVAKRGEAEVDVRAYTPVAPYLLIASNEPDADLQRYRQRCTHFGDATVRRPDIGVERRRQRDDRWPHSTHSRPKPSRARRIRDQPLAGGRH